MTIVMFDPFPVAVREWGYPAVEVARVLNVSSQSILRAVEKGPRMPPGDGAGIT